MMKCRCSKEDHWSKHGQLYLNSPMYHCEDRCPYEVGDCISNCGHLSAPERPCLEADWEVKMREVVRK